MSDSPFVSVIVPVYKAAATISRCIDSLTKQTYPNLEIIAVNDASPDNSLAILKQIASNTPTLRIVDKSQNEGVHAARLDGMKAARGRYLAFSDSDDWSEPDMIENLSKHCRKTQADIVIGGSYLVDAAGKKLGYKTKFKYQELAGPSAFEEFCNLRLGTAALWNKLIQRELALKFAEQDWGWRPDAVEDTLMLIGCLAEANKVVTIQEMLYNYVQHDNAATKSAGNALSFARILRAYASATEVYQDFEPPFKQLVDELYRRQLNMPVYHVYEASDLNSSKDLLEAAVKILAANRPSALYEMANIGIICPGSRNLHKSSLGKLLWAGKATLRSLWSRIR
ncbi:glycosyltransferase [Pelagicoccus sp. SDUM812002]|uniref:glycosyltransferase family 2 protein n=1 Tax=Pelagicoccus sp. SDUM812002 TaxID=3041266 RepID=UPI00280FCA89|nr:glycosyltransferase [Pelagicoccus sp. SDUM812002]MDQ8188473.1 glycosyltransferase [Pelagicoccus sp. SDUM812002]